MDYFYSNECHYFEVVSEVWESWDKVKALPMYQESVGITLFKEMFEIAPDAWSCYSFNKKDVEEKSEKVLVFAARFVRMLDMAVEMLGPDMDIVAEQLAEIGALHKQYGVTARQYDLMDQALTHTLGTLLPPELYTETTKNAWDKIFKFMAAIMMEGAEKA